MGNCCEIVPASSLHVVTQYHRNIDPPNPFRVVELWVERKFPLTIPLPSESGKKSVTLENEQITIEELKTATGAKGVYNIGGGDIESTTQLNGVYALRLTFKTVRMRLYFNGLWSKALGRYGARCSDTFDAVYDIVSFVSLYERYSIPIRSRWWNRRCLLSAFEYTLDHREHILQAYSKFNERWWNFQFLFNAVDGSRDHIYRGYLSKKDVITVLEEIEEAVTELRPLCKILPSDKDKSVSIKASIDPDWTGLLGTASAFLRYAQAVS